jgi:Protein kinase domain
VLVTRLQSSMTSIASSHSTQSFHDVSYCNIILTFSVCSHPFICSLYAAFQDDKHVFMVLEHAALGDLTHVVSDHLKRCLTEAELRFYASEIIAALEWVHLNGVVSIAPFPHHRIMCFINHYSSAAAYRFSRSRSMQACRNCTTCAFSTWYCSCILVLAPAVIIPKN